MAKWLVKELSEIPQTFTSNIHPLLGKILFSRGLSSEKEIEQFIFPSYENDGVSPFLFAHMEKVVERVQKARDEKEKVIIFGDYDADGITSSAILKETFDELGIDCSVYIPDKKSEGYGMNIAAIEQFKKQEVSLIVTVDCGITNIKEVERANELGIDVIITDHHHVPENLPLAYAIINPQQESSGYPEKNLAGVGVAFKVVQALYERLLSEKVSQTKWMLDLVAIGTVADCVPLFGENRLFVKYGLVVLSKTRRIGLKELFTVGRILVDEANCPDSKKISFYIAPRINAAGRINHANLAYNLIVEKNIAEARTLALELEANNTQRQKITEKVVEEVKISAQNMYKDKKFIFAVGEHFPIGIVGLVAGKIAQQFNKPTGIFQKGEELSKGSFRSIEKINIIETISQCSDLLEKFGGHSQAAGATVANKNLEAFYAKMNDLISKQLEGIDLEEEIKIDALLTAEDLDFSLVNDIEYLKPFGEGNLEPVFLLKSMKVKEKRIVGNGNKHIKLFLLPTNGSPKIFEAISFNGYEKFEFIKVGHIIDLVCTLDKDEWNGNQKIQLTMIDAKIN